MSDYQQTVMTGTVVQPAEWHDGVDGEQGYVLFTVHNAINTKFLKDAKSLEYSVVCFGNAGLKVLPYLVKGQTVIFNGQEISWRIGRVVVVPWVKTRGMDFNFEIDSFYRDLEQVDVEQNGGSDWKSATRRGFNTQGAKDAGANATPKTQAQQVQKINANVPPKEVPDGKKESMCVVADEEQKHFLFFGEVTRAVGCKATGREGFKNWVKQYGCTLTDVGVQLFPHITRKSARNLLLERMSGNVRWARGELDKLYAILVEIQQREIVHKILPVEEDKKDVRPECELVKVFLMEHKITYTEVTKRFYALEIKNGRFKNWDSALATFCKYLKKDLFTIDQLRKIMHVAQDLVDEKSKKTALDPASSFADKINLANKTSLPALVEDENGEPLMMETRSTPKPPSWVSSVGVPPIPTFDALKRDNEGENGEPLMMERSVV